MAFCVGSTGDDTELSWEGCNECETIVCDDEALFRLDSLTPCLTSLCLPTAIPTGIDWPELVFLVEDFSKKVLGTFGLSVLLSPTMLEISKAKGLLANGCPVPVLLFPPSHCIFPGAEDGPLKSSTAGVFTDMGDRSAED